MKGRLKTVCDSPLAYALGRWTLAAVFIYSGAVKIPDPRGFAKLISDYGLVPEIGLHATAILLITLELLAGVGLALDLRGGLALVTGLLLLFSAVLVYGIVLGLEIDCGCFGLGRGDPERGTLSSALGRDLVLLVLCGYLYAFRFRNGVRPRSVLGAARRVIHREEA